MSDPRDCFLLVHPRFLSKAPHSTWIFLLPQQQFPMGWEKGDAPNSESLESQECCWIQDGIPLGSREFQTQQEGEEAPIGFVRNWRAGNSNGIHSGISIPTRSEWFWDGKGAPENPRGFFRRDYLGMKSFHQFFSITKKKRKLQFCRNFWNKPHLKSFLIPARP